jgi:hypothetical protein
MAGILRCRNTTKDFWRCTSFHEGFSVMHERHAMHDELRSDCLILMHAAQKIKHSNGSCGVLAYGVEQMSKRRCDEGHFDDKLLTKLLLGWI